MMNVIFQVVDQQELEWKEVHKLMGKVNDSAVAVSMHTCGFSLKCYLPDADSYDKEYTTVICGSDVPTHIILNVMQMVLVANGGNRVGGAMTKQDINSVRDGGNVVRGYWAKKDAPRKEPVKKAPPKDVVRGYWAKKDAPVGGSLFDSEETPEADNSASNPSAGSNTPAASGTAVGTSAGAGAAAAAAAAAKPSAPGSKPVYGRRKEAIQVGSLFDND